jgi:hypothetical protein
MMPLSKNIVYLLIFAFCASAAPATTSDLRTPVIITLPETATVADIFATKVDGKHFIKMPNSPHFYKTISSFSSVNGSRENSYGAYPAYYNPKEPCDEYYYKTIPTLAAFLRFLDEIPQVCQEPSDKKKIKQIIEGVKHCALTYRHPWTWLDKKVNPYGRLSDQERLTNLRNEEASLYAELSKLPLNDPFIKNKVESILSTHPDSLPTNVINALFFPFRSKIAETSFASEPKIEISNFSPSGMYVAAMLAFACLSSATKHNSIKNFATGGLLGSGVLLLISVCANILNSTANLAPEPGHGIKVTINLVPAETAPTAEQT